MQLRDWCRALDAMTT